MTTQRQQKISKLKSLVTYADDQLANMSDHDIELAIETCQRVKDQAENRIYETDNAGKHKPTFLCE